MLRPTMLLLLTLTLVACRRGESGGGAPPAAAPRIAIRFQTDWYPQAEHGGFYQALARGFYAEAGLDVTILPGGPGARTPQKVIAGAADMAMYRSDDLILQAAEGLPFVFIAAFMQHDPQALLLHAGNPIDSFAELDGHRVMAMPGTNWIAYLQRRYDITLEIVPMNFSLAQFLADPEFVQQCFITSEPFHAQQQGVATKTLLIADSGYDPYRVIFTTHRFVRENPEAVRAFVAASLRGWREFITEDPSPGKALIQARNPSMSEALLDYSIAAMRQHRLVTGDPAEGEELGQLSRERVTEQRDLLHQLGLLTQPLPLEQFVRFDLLPAEVDTSPATAR